MEPVFLQIRILQVLCVLLVLGALTLVYQYTAPLMLVRPSVIGCLVTPESQCVAHVAADATFPSRRYSSNHPALDHLAWTDEVERVRQDYAAKPPEELGAGLSFPLAARAAFDIARTTPDHPICTIKPSPCLIAAGHAATRGVWPIEDALHPQLRPRLDAEELHALTRLLTAGLSSLDERESASSSKDKAWAESADYLWLRKIIDALHPKTRAALPDALVARIVAAAETAQVIRYAPLRESTTRNSRLDWMSVLIERKEWAQALELAQELLPQVDLAQQRDAAYIYCCGQSDLALATVFARNGDARTAMKIARTIESHGDKTAKLHTFQAFRAFEYYKNAILMYLELQEYAEARRLLSHYIETVPIDDGGRATCGFYGCDDFPGTRRGIVESAADAACRLDSGEISAQVIALARDLSERISIFHGVDQCLTERGSVRTPLEIADSVGAPPAFEIFIAGLHRALERGDRDRAATILREAIDHGRAVGVAPSRHLRRLLRAAVILDDHASVQVIARKLIFIASLGWKERMATDLAAAAVLLAAAERATARHPATDNPRRLNTRTRSNT
jgi:hypothetical protein